MPMPSHSTRLRAQLDRLARGTRPAGPPGLWAVAGDRVVALDAPGIASATLLVPTEEVLLLGVDLPLPSHRRRMQALPFALEDRVADDPATLHLALGHAIADGRYLAAVVDHAAMRRWVAGAAAADLAYAALLPDALMLPPPPVGMWAIDLSGRRALVRAGDGTGFAVAAPLLAQAWIAAGRPSCIAHGDPLPEPLAVAVVAPEVEAAPLADRLARPAIDLRQGAYAPPGRTMPAAARRLAIVLGAGAMAHAAIAAADTIALTGVAERREAETRALVEQVAPGRVAADGDLVSAAADLLPEGGAAMPGRFVPLINRASAALQPLGPLIALRGLDFSDADGTLALDVEAPDVATLQRVAAILSAAGLSATSGGAVAEGDRAVGTITIREGAPA